MNIKRNVMLHQKIQNFCRKQNNGYFPDGVNRVGNKVEENLRVNLTNQQTQPLSDVQNFQVAVKLFTKTTREEKFYNQKKDRMPKPAKRKTPCVGICQQKIVFGPSACPCHQCHQCWNSFVDISEVNRQVIYRTRSAGSIYRIQSEVSVEVLHLHL